jgi:hypothetical protein
MPETSTRCTARVNGTIYAMSQGMNALSPAAILRNSASAALASRDATRIARALGAVAYYDVRETHRIATLAGTSCAANDGAGLAPWTVGM